MRAEIPTSMFIRTTFPLQVLALVAAASLTGSAVATATPTKKNVRKAARNKATPTKAAANVPAIFFDEEWSYRTATLYGEEKNISSSVSGTAKFGRDGKFRQAYYIGGIGNFFKGTYKIAGDRLSTFDEKGKPIFTFRFTVGTSPKILVLSLLEKDGVTKSIDYSLVPIEKKP